MSQWFWHSHLRPLITSQQGTALTILALLKGTDAEIGSAWVQQHVKTFAEGFVSQVTFCDWSADQANKIWLGPDGIARPFSTQIISVNRDVKQISVGFKKVTVEASEMTVGYMTV